MSLSTIRIRPVVAALALVAAVFIAGSATGQQEQDIFTWTDDEGVRHFSAYPPIDREYERVETRSGTAQASSPAPETEDPQPPDVPQMRQTEPDPEVVAERCEQARSNLELLQQDGPAVLRQAEGEPTPLDDDQRQELIEETEQFIEQWC
ncbi:MAG: DUF4124 domain-containing protein [Wenzhouxiangella sp.]